MSVMHSSRKSIGGAKELKPQRKTKASLSDSDICGSESDHTLNVSHHRKTRVAVAPVHTESKKSLKVKTDKRGHAEEKVEATLRSKECTLPRGILAMHIKKLTLESLEMYKLFQKYNATMYIRISCQGQIKCTTAYHNVTCPSVTLVDEIKHFRLTLSTKKMDLSNFLRVDLIACTNVHAKRIHRILCGKDLHLFDIIKNLYSVDPIQLRNDDKQIGELDVEICFAYGSFGYGYSSQFLNRNKTTQENIAYSMLCYAEPPTGREDFATDVMMSRHIGHPTFIDFKKKVDIGITETFKNDLECYSDLEQATKTQLLRSKISKGLHGMQKEYGEQPNRVERLAYLRRKVSQPGGYTDLDTNRFEVNPDYHLRYSNQLSESQSKSKMAAMKLLRDQDAENIPSTSESRPGLTKFRRVSRMAGVFGTFMFGKTAEVKPDDAPSTGVTKDQFTIKVPQPADTKVKVNVTEPYEDVVIRITEFSDRSGEPSEKSLNTVSTSDEKMSTSAEKGMQKKYGMFGKPAEVKPDDAPSTGVTKDQFTIKVPQPAETKVNVNVTDPYEDVVIRNTETSAYKLSGSASKVYDRSGEPSEKSLNTASTSVAKMASTSVEKGMQKEYGESQSKDEMDAVEPLRDQFASKLTREHIPPTQELQPGMSRFRKGSRRLSGVLGLRAL